MLRFHWALAASFATMVRSSAKHLLVELERALLVAGGELEVADGLQILGHVDLPFGQVGLRQRAAYGQALLQRGERAVAVAHVALHSADLGQVQRDLALGVGSRVRVGETAGDGERVFEGRERALVVVGVRFRSPSLAST